MLDYNYDLRTRRQIARDRWMKIIEPTLYMLFGGVVVWGLTGFLTP